jgi:hypothetical protein
MDKSLGDLLDHLDALGVAENTLVFFLGDNGSDAPLGTSARGRLRGTAARQEGSTLRGWDAGAVHRSLGKAGCGQPLAAEAEDSGRGCAGSGGQRLRSVSHDHGSCRSADAPAGHIVDGEVDAEPAGGWTETQSGQRVVPDALPPLTRTAATISPACETGDWKVVYHYFPSAQSEGVALPALQSCRADPFESRNVAVSQQDVLTSMMQRLAAELEKHNALYPIAAPDDPTPVLPIVP